jgi:hypothetical protein
MTAEQFQLMLNMIANPRGNTQGLQPATVVPVVQQHTAAKAAWIKSIAEAEETAVNKVNAGLNAVRKQYDKSKRAEKAHLKINELVEKGGVLQCTIPIIPKALTVSESANEDMQKYMKDLTHDYSRKMTTVIRNGQLAAKTQALAECEKIGKDLLDDAINCITRLAGSRDEFANDATLSDMIQQAIDGVKSHAARKYNQLKLDVDDAYAKQVHITKPLEDAWKEDAQAPDVDMEQTGANVAATSKAEIEAMIAKAVNRQATGKSPMRNNTPRRPSKQGQTNQSHQSNKGSNTMRNDGKGKRPQFRPQNHHMPPTGSRPGTPTKSRPVTPARGRQPPGNPAKQGRANAQQPRNQGGYNTPQPLHQGGYNTPQAKNGVGQGGGRRGEGTKKLRRNG